MNYRYGGAKALVLLHELEIWRFLTTWREAREAALPLPVTDDRAYESLDALAAHVLSAARNYMIWICDKLELPHPALEESPSKEEVARQAESYTDHLLERWRLPLAGVGEKAFYKPEYDSRWGVKYCVDAMLEHAVMHPIRHRFQLERLMAVGAGDSE